MIKDIYKNNNKNTCKGDITIFFEDDIIPLTKLLCIKDIDDLKAFDINSNNLYVECVNVVKNKEAKYYIHRWTYDMIICNTRGLVLTITRCKHKDCKRSIITTFNAIKNHEIKTCPCCFRNMY